MFERFVTANYQALARQIAQRYGIDPGVFVRQIQQESGFNPNARSGAGAQGIAQFMPATARQYGVNLNDGNATDDLVGAAKYDRDALKRGGSYSAMLSIYNSGRPDGYKSIPETKNYVQKILGGASPTDSAPRALGGSTGASTGMSGDTRKQLLLGYLANRHDPNALMGLATGLKNAQASDVPVGIDQVAQPGSVPGNLAKFVQNATKIDSKQMPYQWGGGHAGKVNAATTGPLDCSGAVSAVLGINPKVAADFKQWGKPGAGKSVTIYAKDSHVLMEINHHFFGTSGSNAGGGAGWIPRSAISADYLKGFTQRHPVGM